MAVDDLIREECLLTLRRGAIDDSIHLSRRHRWKPLAMHVHQHVGAVLVAHRGKRVGLTVRTYCFDLRVDPPEPMHLSAGSYEDAPTIERRSSIAEWGPAPAMTVATTGRRGRWCVCMQLKAEVRTWQTGDASGPVPDHGWIVVLGNGLHQPKVQLFDQEGRSLGRTY